MSPQSHGQVERYYAISETVLRKTRLWIQQSKTNFEKYRFIYRQEIVGLIQVCNHRKVQADVCARLWHCLGHL